MEMKNAWVAIAALVAGCGTMSKAESHDGMWASFPLYGGALALSEVVVPPSGDFALAGAPEGVATLIYNHWLAASDCREVELDGATVALDLTEGCTLGEHTLGGTVGVEVIDVSEASVTVQYAWGGFAIGDVTVDGSTAVTWHEEIGEDDVHTLAGTYRWTDADGTTREVDSAVDVTVRRNASDELISGFAFAGEQTSTGPTGTWHMAVTSEFAAVELRAGDWSPVDGEYELTNVETEEALYLYFSCLEGDLRRVGLDRLRANGNVRDRRYLAVNADGSIEEMEFTGSFNTRATDDCRG